MSDRKSCDHIYEELLELEEGFNTAGVSGKRTQFKQDAEKLISHLNVCDICFSRKIVFRHLSLIISPKRRLYHHLLGPKGNVQPQITV